MSYEVLKRDGYYYFDGIAGSRVPDTVSEHVSDEQYRLDPTLESYEETIARIDSSSRIAEDIHRKSQNTDPLTAATLRACATAIWRNNLSDYQRIFMRRGMGA